MLTRSKHTSAALQLPQPAPDADPAGLHRHPKKAGSPQPGVRCQPGARFCHTRDVDSPGWELATPARGGGSSSTAAARSSEPLKFTTVSQSR